MSIRQGIFIACCAISVLLLSQCTNTLAPSQVEMKDTKSVTVSFGIKTNKRFNDVAEKAYVRVSAMDIDTITRPMTITDSMLYGTVENIPVGAKRQFEILVYDSVQSLRYYGFKSVDLQVGVATRVVISIGRISGPVEIIGIIKDTADTSWQPDTADTVLPNIMIPWHPDTGDTLWQPDTGDTVLPNIMIPWHPDTGDTLWYPDTGDTLWQPDTGDTLWQPDTGDTLWQPDTGDTLWYPDTMRYDTLWNDTADIIPISKDAYAPN